MNNAINPVSPGSNQDQFSLNTIIQHIHQENTGIF